MTDFFPNSFLDVFGVSVLLLFFFIFYYHYLYLNYTLNNFNGFLTLIYNRENPYKKKK